MNANLLVVLLFGFSATASAPTVDPGDDANNLGAPDDFLFWEPKQQVAGYRNMDRIFPTPIVFPIAAIMS